MKAALQKYGPPVLSGVLLASCFPVFNLYPLVWIALIPLLAGSKNDAPMAAARQFFVAGFVFHVILLQWMITNIMWAGGWAIIGQQLLCVVLALFWAASGAAWSWARNRASALLAALSLPVFWVAMEQLQGTVFTGLGWSTLVYSQGTDLALIQWAAIGSAPFVSLFIVLTNALFALAIADKKARYPRLAVGLLIIAGAHAGGYLLLDDAEYGDNPFRVGIFQSNFPQEMKWDRAYTLDMVEKAVEHSLALAREEDIDLMVWPEALVMGDITDPLILDSISSAVRGGGFQLFTGAARRENGRDYNSSYLIGEEARIIDTYDKIHLAPFGEYIPFSSYLPFVARFVPSIGGMTAGTEPTVMRVGDRWLGPLICFEMLFPPMSQRLKAEGADFLTVITNLGWFGRSNALPQEIDIARIRAIETRLPLVHSANTGISGVFDPWGRFTMVDAVVDPRGRLVRTREGIRPRDIIMNRLVGAFDLAQPGQSPVPYPPHYLAWSMLPLSLALIAFAGWIGKRKTIQTPEQS
ncbi:MAG: apolipoprotein N-acyltransferase [Candidatus Hydrogenedentes bacterium]|nr:apolipoprotein N-acyltransferase [Candidatus Hydrogenedentota bacterium]